jgi:multiple antibiotic resistance protein
MEFNHSEIIMFLFTGIGPLKVTIACASLTADASPAFCKQVAFRSVVISLIVCLVFAVLGEAILKLMKVSIPAFQIGGGIIVLLFSLDMVMGDKQADENSAGESRKKTVEPSLDIATYPLAIPLMASVSGLVAIVSTLAQHDDLESLVFLTGAIVAIMAINFFCLRFCKYIVRAAGPAGLQVIGRLMGVIMTALAVELIIMGLVGLGLISKTDASSKAVSSSSAKAAVDEGMMNSPVARLVGNSPVVIGPNLPITGIGGVLQSKRRVPCIHHLVASVRAGQSPHDDRRAELLISTRRTIRETDAFFGLVY